MMAKNKKQLLLLSSYYYYYYYYYYTAPATAVTINYIHLTRPLTTSMTNPKYTRVGDNEQQLMKYSCNASFSTSRPATSFGALDRSQSMPTNTMPHNSHDGNMQQIISLLFIARTKIH